MKKAVVFLSCIFLLLSLVAVSSFAADTKFSLKDVPSIANKRPLNIVIETGESFDKTLPAVQEFTKQTGVKVNVERIASSGVYGKENVELLAGTGFYDLVYVETSWTTEWSDYLFKLSDLANKYDPGKEAAMFKDMAYMSPSILLCGQAYAEQYVLHFYPFDMGMWVRQDVFDDPTEKANFKKAFGYDLEPAKDWHELMNQAKFFTRKKGELLKGKPLDHDIFGLSMQAGAYQDNDETTARLWGRMADWVTVVRDKSGKVTKFVITKFDKQALKDCLQEYKTALQWDSPGALTANFDFVVAQIGNGNAIIAPTMWANCTVWANGILKDKVPGAKIGLYSCPGGQGYTGAWSFGVSKVTKNPEAAYWLLRWLTSYDCGTTIFKEGGQVPARMDVLEDPSIHTAEGYYPLGMIADWHIYSWKNTARFIPDHWYWTTKAGGKVYDMQIYVEAKALTGEWAIDRTVNEIEKQTLEMVSKFDKVVPISEEK